MKSKFAKIQYINSIVLAPIDNKPRLYWYLSLFISIIALLIGFLSLYKTVFYGLGTWGINRTVGWGISIVNFVWWIGIGHAGTFISAILLIFRRNWRNSIGRIAETMTVLAIICGALFPIIHMGRIFFMFYTFPYPNTRNLWVNFNSPLLWDVFAITGYFLVSLVFWYLGMVPDLHYYSNKVKSVFKKKIFSKLSFFWTGHIDQWIKYEKTIWLIASFATALVVSVHSIVSFDFAASIIPGWHSTLFPPYFVAGAILSGFCMLISIVIIARKTMGLEKLITKKQINYMGQIVVYAGIFVALSYITEIFFQWYSGNTNELFLLKERFTGSYNVSYLAMLFCNILLPQLFRIRKVRYNLNFVFVLSLLINFGMWLERYIIIVSSLSKGYMSSRWIDYKPSMIEIGLFIGSLGLFFTGFLILSRILPMISANELFKEITNHKTINYENY